MGEVIKEGGCRGNRGTTLENSGKSPAKPKQRRPRTEFTNGEHNLRLFTIDTRVPAVDRLIKLSQSLGYQQASRLAEH